MSDNRKDIIWLAFIALCFFAPLLAVVIGGWQGSFFGRGL